MSRLICFNLNSELKQLGLFISLLVKYARMGRLVLAFAGRTYHIVGNLMSRLICFNLNSELQTKGLFISLPVK